MSALTAPATQTWVNGRERMDGWMDGSDESFLPIKIKMHVYDKQER